MPVLSFWLQEGTPQVSLLWRIHGYKFKYCNRAICSSVRKSIRMVKFLEAWGYAHRTQQQFGKPGCFMRLPGEARFCKGRGFVFYFDAGFALGFSLPRCRPQSACLATKEEKGTSCQDSFQWLLKEPLFSRLPPRILLVIPEKGGKGVKLPIQKESRHNKKTHRCIIFAFAHRRPRSSGHHQRGSVRGGQHHQGGAQLQPDPAVSGGVPAGR